MGFFRHSKNYYAILGVDTTATRDQIKTAWRNKVKECHPDRVRSYPEKIARTKKLQELNEALEILGDMRKRSDYDTWYQANLQNPISHPHEEKKREKPSSTATSAVLWPRVLALFVLFFWLLGTFYLFFEGLRVIEWANYIQRPQHRPPVRPLQVELAREVIAVYSGNAQQQHLRLLRRPTLRHCHPNHRRSISTEKEPTRTA